MCFAMEAQIVLKTVYEFRAMAKSKYWLHKV